MRGQASDAQIQHAAQRLAHGKLVAFPTETVYGLGADAENASAVDLIYSAKGRPANHPVIVHVAPEAALSYWATEIPAQAYLLIEAFWPGPLTLILKRVLNRAPRVSGGQTSIGLRCPAHPVAQQLLRAFAALRPSGQGGVAAPSANRFGHVSPTQAQHVRAEFATEVAAGMPVLQGGAATLGLESTIIDLSRIQEGVGPVLLRPGHIQRSDIAAVLGIAPAQPDAAAPRVSGGLKAHYAPRTPLVLVSCAQLHAMASGDSPPPSQRAIVIAYTSRPPSILPPTLAWHPIAAAPTPYAQSLYALLRKLDGENYQQILVEMPPCTAAWEAVNDRLSRAAASFN